MTSPYSVIIPLINPNEPEARLGSIHIVEGQQVNIGDLLCVLETTKSTNELNSEIDGYVIGLSCEPGETILAGDILCYIAPSPDWEPPEIPLDKLAPIAPIPEGLHISQPALELAKSHDIDLGLLPIGRFITTQMVQDLIEQTQENLPEFNPSTIIIYGGGGHCKALIDLLRAVKTYSIGGIIDDGIAPGQLIMDLPVLGGKDILSELHKRGAVQAVNAVGGIGNVSSRVKVFQTLSEDGFSYPVLVHPQAFVEPSASLSEGVQVFPHAYIGSEASVGFGSIINTGAIISHDCVLGDYVNISPGAILAGEVHVGDRVLIGMGATINLQVNIGSGARIGNSATVKSNVPENGIVHAGSTWPN